MTITEQPETVTGPAIDSGDVQAAAERLRGVAHRTPVLTSRTLDAMTGAQVYLKAEPFQRIGARVAADLGATMIPPYDHPLVMAGNGTTALELIEEVGELDVLLVCLGGGGLLSGCATAAKALSPGIEIWGVEPAAGDDWAQSYSRGERVRLNQVPRTIADGQQTEAPGVLTWRTVRPLVTGIVTVSDDEIRDAMRFLFERVKLVTEPSGASALAALMTGQVEGHGKRVGVTISGGNIRLDGFCQIVAGRDG